MYSVIVNNSVRIRQYLLGSLLCLCANTLSFADELPLTLIPIEGSQSASANQILTYEIKRSGFFYLAKPEPGAFVVKGLFIKKGFEGEMYHPDGHKLFKRTYKAGNLIRDMRQFADDIVLAATDRPGIATSQIAFVGIQNSKSDIYVCDYDGKNIRQITNDGLPKRHPCLSPNGKDLYFTGAAQQAGGIYKIDLSSDKRMRIADTHGVATEKAVVSPDGKHLAIVLANGSNSDLYLSRSSGKFRKLLTRSAIAEFQPSWSADGKSLVYSALLESGKTKLFIVSAKDGSNPKPLSINLPNPSQPTWSPSGQHIAFVSGDSKNRSIAIHDLRDRSSRVLVAGQSPAWGADSRHLIYTVNGSLYRIDTDTGEKISVIAGGGQIYDPSWTR